MEKQQLTIITTTYFISTVNTLQLLSLIPLTQPLPQQVQLSLIPLTPTLPLPKQVQLSLIPL